jgi:putative transposase
MVIYRNTACAPNEVWQADHSLLPILLYDEQGKPAKPWLTILLDDYSRGVPGYYLGFANPTALQTALTLHQAIWHKADARWLLCGIPARFYTDNGSDFTSQHLEQVAADLKIDSFFPGLAILAVGERLSASFAASNNYSCPISLALWGKTAPQEERSCRFPPLTLVFGPG